jgi:hypothetical protein
MAPKGALSKGGRTAEFLISAAESGGKKTSNAALSCNIAFDKLSNEVRHFPDRLPRRETVIRITPLGGPPGFRCGLIHSQKIPGITLPYVRAPFGPLPSIVDC